MEKASADLMEVSITEKKRVKIRESWSSVDEPRVTIYVERKDLQLFMELMYMHRDINSQIGIKPRY